MKIVPPLKLKLIEFFGIDPRSMALFRIGLGALVCFDLVFRYQDLFAHYSDGGVLPRAIVMEEWTEWWRWSFHFASGNTGVLSLFFLGNLISALFLMLGFKARINSLICYVFLISIQNRNPLLFHGGDLLLRLLLFWSLFLPLDSYFSINRIFRGGSARLRYYFSAGTVAILLQVLFVYWFSVLQKTGSSWWDEGSALKITLNYDQVVKPFGRWLLNFPNFLRTMTYGTLLLESVGPFVLFIPFYTQAFRLVTVLFFVLFHLATAVCLRLGLFPFVCILGLTLFLPPLFWEGINKLQCISRFRNEIQLKIDNFRQAFVFNSHENFSKIKKLFFILGNVTASLIIFYIFLWNIHVVFPRIFPVGFEKSKWIVYFIGVDQAWGMYSPDPNPESGEFKLIVNYPDGLKTNILSNKENQVEGKYFQSQSYENIRWDDYFIKIGMKKNGRFRYYLGRFLCNQSDKTPMIQSVEFQFIKKTAELENNLELRSRMLLLWKQECLPAN